MSYDRMSRERGAGPGGEESEAARGSEWRLTRAYASPIAPNKGKLLPAPATYGLKLDAAFRQALTTATSGATRQPLSAVMLRMQENRVHPVRELVMKVAFGQTRAPLGAAIDLAARLASFTDHRTGTSLLVTMVEEASANRRVSLYVFPEEESYQLQISGSEQSEAIFERLSSFVLKSRLRKVARFEGKDIRTHFMQAKVADLLIGSSSRTAADYWVTSFLDAEFAITPDKGTRLVALGLRKAFDGADASQKQDVMEATTALVASKRQTWSLHAIAKEYLPEALYETFCSAAANAETRRHQFTLDKTLLRERINYRVFQLETGVWVSAPFSEVGETVKVSGTGDRRKLSASGVIVSEQVQPDARKPRNR